MMRLALLLSILAALMAASVAEAAVYWHGHRVRATLVGAIDASPCSDPSGCVRGVVDVKFKDRHAQHLVRCGHPRRLHVVRVFRDSGVRWVTVYACSHNYVWRLP